jgi:hypothetical protein
MAWKRTAFVPSINGFKFKNNFPENLVEDELIRQGFDISTVLILKNALFGSLSVETWGLCGGMCWAALDRYYRKEDPPSDTSPPLEGPIFEELVTRQVASLKPQGPPYFYYVFQKLLEYAALYKVTNNKILDSLISSSDWDYIGWDTQSKEWPKVKDTIDNGYPATLCLIRTKSADIWKNHQVIATGYNYDDNTQKLELAIYDPNYPTNDGVIITMNFGKQLEASQSPGNNLYGFFVIPYDKIEVAFDGPDSWKSEISKERCYKLLSEKPWFWTVFTS